MKLLHLLKGLFMQYYKPKHVIALRYNRIALKQCGLKNIYIYITNPNMNVTEFFQPHSKVTFLFLQSPQFQNFPSLYNVEIFRKLINLLFEGSWSNSKSEMITAG